MPITSTFASQSVYVNEVLDAFQSLLEKALGWSEDRVIEWHDPSRSASVDKGRSIVWFGFVNRQLDDQSGAGRWGTRQAVLMEVNLTSRLFGDSVQKDKRLVRKHINSLLQIENAFYGQMLFPSYQDRDGDEPPVPVSVIITDQDRQDRINGVSGAPIACLTVATMTAAELPKPERPRPEQGYLTTRIGIAVPCVLRITTGNDADAPLPTAP